VGGAAQRHPLEPASAVAARLQPERAELRRDIAGGDLMPARAGAAPFQQVVRQELDMGPNPVGRGAKVGGGSGRR
jgi:hypothetical protein